MLKVIFAAIIGAMLIAGPTDGLGAFSMYRDYMLALLVAFLVHPWVIRQFD
ncbi:MAG: hypothetical protein IDH49_05270 [Gammaproteobacteria bacterium]|nr:hypothetical protein [Gammaproteobacteria bacterium]